MKGLFHIIANKILIEFKIRLERIEKEIEIEDLKIVQIKAELLMLMGFH
jgi:hypothetical protein